MKPPILLLTCLLFVTCPAFSQNNQNDPARFNALDKYIQPVKVKKKLRTPELVLGIDKPESVHGIVKYVVDKRYVLEDEKDKEGFYLQNMTKEYWFDRSGKLIRLKWYDLIPCEKQFFYNKDGQIKRVVTTYNDKKVDSLVYKYDANGLMRDRWTYINSILQDRKIVNYDSFSRPTVEYTMGTNGPEVSKRYYYNGTNSTPDSLKPTGADIHLYHYRNAILLWENWINPKTRRLARTKTYNNKGELIEDLSNDLTKYKYTYDRKGNWVTKLIIERHVTGVFTYDLVKRKVEYY